MKKGAIYLNTNEGYVDENNLRFIGRVGAFCPMNHTDAGELVKSVVKKDDTVAYDSVTGAKGYLWMTREDVVEQDLIDYVDTNYYNKLVDKAIDTINNFGDFEWFVSEDPYVPQN